MEGIIVVKDSEITGENAEIYSDPAKVKLMLHPHRIEMLKILDKKALYPSELARRMKMSEQQVYYHLTKLIDSELLEIAEEKAIRGTVAKKYRPKNMNIGLILKRSRNSVNEIMEPARKAKTRSLFTDMISHGRLDAKIIVGTPDPHGPYKARARDSHYAIELALYLGQFGDLPQGFSVEQDVEAQILTSHLILVGGPMTNLIFGRINQNLSVKFRNSRPFELYSKITKKSYGDDNVGLLCKVPNPHFPEKSVLCFAGISREGTRAAVMALTRFEHKTLKEYIGQKEWYRVVEGFDLDGDGKIDSVEMRE